ncbi:MAG: hypothetical protein ACOCWR_09725, partial [Oceanidesulfovibrio sp.]
VEALRVLETGGERSEAAYFFTKAVMAHPEHTQSLEFFASKPFMDLVDEIHEALRHVDVGKVRG